MTKWEISYKPKTKNNSPKPEELVQILLKNRGVNTKRKQREFLAPDLKKITIASVGINKVNLLKAIKRIQKAIENQEQIVVFGDYDVDGICGSAILWETLNGIGAKVLPYIPNRIEEGYGLSVKGIENLKSQLPTTKLIITVDNGIVATKAVDFAKTLGIDVIITDHHVPAKKLPKAYSIVHTTQLCGAGVAYMLSQEIFSTAEVTSENFLAAHAKQLKPINKIKPANSRDKNFDSSPQFNHLELVALATVSDLVPLKNANRILLKFGLEKLRQTKRIGLIALFTEAVLNQKDIGVYEIGHIIAPRLNAMGRLNSAMDSLRLICTTDRKRAEELALKLGSTNKERRGITENATLHAREFVKSQKKLGNLLFISHKSYQQGVIGLIAGRLAEEFYLPTIIVSEGEVYSKASARSIAGFNIIEFIRSASDILVDVGGHPMAAGFTVETKKIAQLKKRLELEALRLISEDLKNRSLKIDCELNFSAISQEVFDKLQTLAPFGAGNSQPVFVAKGVKVESARLVGNDKHLKLKLSHSGKIFDAIFFGAGDKKINVGDEIDVVYLLDENIWNGNKTLQLKIRDIGEN